MHKKLSEMDKSLKPRMKPAVYRDREGGVYIMLPEMVERTGQK